MASTIRICADPQELAERAAARIAGAARRAVAERGRFTLGLSGGDTPGPTYSRLAEQHRDDVPWQAVHVFWGDERCIPLERPDNHFTMATRLMLSQLPIPPESIHRIYAEAVDPSAAADEYEAELRRCFRTDGYGPPAFDLLLLGMGEDGHVASMYPGSAGLKEDHRWVVDHYVLKRGERLRRLSLTMPVLTAAREVMILVSGDHKAEALAGVLSGEADVPARWINSQAARVVWMVTADAAVQLRTLHSASMESETT